MGNLDETSGQVGQSYCAYFYATDFLLAELLVTSEVPDRSAQRHISHSSLCLAVAGEDAIHKHENLCFLNFTCFVVLHSNLLYNSC